MNTTLGTKASRAVPIQATIVAVCGLLAGSSASPSFSDEPPSGAPEAAAEAAAPAPEAVEPGSPASDPEPGTAEPGGAEPSSADPAGADQPAQIEPAASPSTPDQQAPASAVDPGDPPPPGVSGLDAGAAGDGVFASPLVELGSPAASPAERPAVRRKADPPPQSGRFDIAESCPDIGPNDFFAEQQCAEGVDQANEACDGSDDPAACQRALRSSPCFRHWRSTACLAFINDNEVCFHTQTADGPECKAIQAMRSFYCARSRFDVARCQGGGSFPGEFDPLDPALLAAATGDRVLVASVGGGGPPAGRRSLGIRDPGALGDAGEFKPTAGPSARRKQLPFSGYAVLGPLVAAALLLAAGALLRRRLRPVFDHA